MAAKKITVDYSILVNASGDGGYTVTVYSNNVTGVKYTALTNNMRLIDAYNNREENERAAHNATIDLIDFVMREHGVTDYTIS